MPIEPAAGTMSRNLAPDCEPQKRSALRQAKPDWAEDEADLYRRWV